MNKPAHLRIRELETEIERLRRIEKAAKVAFDYHMLGYRAFEEFNANSMLSLMNKLGEALEPKL